MASTNDQNKTPAKPPTQMQLILAAQAKKKAEKEAKAKSRPTPSPWSAAMSSAGMIPPPVMSTSSRPCARSRSRILGKSVMCAPLRMDSPTTSTSSCTAAVAIISGVWCRPV